MNDRIKLAEAMGWTHETGGGRDWYHPTDKRSRCFAIHLPDPFTDANDDYAVLEHFRATGQKDEIHRAMTLSWAVDYKIGDYAKAALKVM